MTYWDIKELGNMVQQLYGTEQRDHANLHLKAVAWKLRTAEYHLRQAYHCISEVTDLMNTVKHPLKLILPSGEDFAAAKEAMYEQHHIYEANIIAAAQSTHSVSDIIAHAIYDCLKMEDIEQHKMNLKSVKAKLPNGELKDSVIRFLGRADFCYLQDFVNTTKHRSLVQTMSNVDLTKAPYEYEINLDEFSYSLTKHKAKSGATFLKEMESLNLQYINLGNDVNEHLKELAK